MEPISDEIKTSKVDEKSVSKGLLQSVLKVAGVSGTAGTAALYWLFNYATASYQCSDEYLSLLEPICSIMVNFQNDTLEKLNQDKVTKYRDEMDALIKDGLIKSKYDDKDFIIASAKTANTLPVLDPDSQGSVFNYLERSKLNTLHGNKGLLFKSQMSKSKLIKANLSKFKLIEVNLIGADLRGADLTGADLTGAKLMGADLTGAKLMRATFIGADLTGAKLIRSNLTEANFSGATLNQVDFDRANLYNAKFNKKATFEGASLKTVQFELTQTKSLSGGIKVDIGCCRADFSEADLSGAIFTGADFSNINLSGADLRSHFYRGANFNNAILTNAKLGNSYLDGTKFIGADLTKADFSKAILKNVEFDDADLTKTEFSEATLENVKFDKTILYKTSFGKFHNEPKGKYDSWYESSTIFKKPTAKQSLELSLVCDLVLATRAEFKMTKTEYFAEEDHLDKDRDCEKLPERLVSRYPDKFKDIEAAKAFLKPKQPSK